MPTRAIPELLHQARGRTPRAVYSNFGPVSLIALLTLSIQNSILRLAVCILHPTETQSPSHIQNTKDTPTTLRHYVITITSSSGPNGGSSALPRPSSYMAAPRRTAPGPSNLCPSYLTTFRKDRCDELERSASHFLGPTDHF